MTKKKDEKKAVKSKTVKKIGRPSKYNKEIGEKICDLILDNYSIRKICELEGMPNSKTIFKWLDKHEEFNQLYARARRYQSEQGFDELLDIIRQPPSYYEDAKGVKRVDPGFVQHQRNKADRLEWILRTRQRRNYGGDAYAIATENTEKGQALPPITISLSDKD